MRFIFPQIGGPFALDEGGGKIVGGAAGETGMNTHSRVQIGMVVPIMAAAASACGSPIRAKMLSGPRSTASASVACYMSRCVRRYCRANAVDALLGVGLT